MNEANLQTTAAALQAPYSQGGLTFSRRFSTEGVSPYDDVQWERRTALITDSKGNTIFEQKDVEVPADWSMTATNIVASKYLHGHDWHAGARDRRAATGVRALPRPFATGVLRAVILPARATPPLSTTSWRTCCLRRKWPSTRLCGSTWAATASSPFRDGQNWHWDPTTGGVVHAATGYKNPQCSACFINSVDDSLESILTLAKTEGMLFKWGSGTGTNLSAVSRSMPRRRDRRWHGQRSAQLHARLRRIRRRHQVRRQDASRGQDGRSLTSTILTSSTSSSASRRKKPKPTRSSATDTTAQVRTPKPTRPSSSRTPTTPCA